ncbi:MAG: redoxin domain-containing protein [Candidatus Acidiferrales bacterium]
MSNAITGDFDVVAQFTILAADRVLAAMHQTERFLHSLTASVNDNPSPGTVVNNPVVVGVVDAFGDAVTNQNLVGKPQPLSGSAAVANPLFARVDPIINAGVISAGGSVIPSHLSGTAQLQLFPPTVDVPDNKGSNLLVRMNTMARYFPDKNTAPLAEFIRGDLFITAAVNQIAVPSGHMVNIDFKAQDAVINFTPSYSSNTLSAADLAGINQLIRNALQTSFLPSSASLPSNIAQVQFKTMLTSSMKALAIMLNVTSHAANPSSFADIFVNPTDDFAFAAGREFVLAQLQPVINNLLSQPFPDIRFNLNLLLTTWHVSYPVTLQSASFDLQPGEIVMNIQGHAGQSNHGALGPFDFSLSLDFSLAPAGTTAVLVPGSVSVNISGVTGLVAEIVDLFTGKVSDAVKAARDQALSQSGADDMVQSMFDTNANLGNFLNSLLKPATSNAPVPSQQITLTYNSIEIQQAGIVLRGSLSLLPWAPIHVEFEQVPANVGTGPGSAILPHPPDYSALKSWIPGGTVGQYEWSTEGAEQAYPFEIDPHKFILLSSMSVGEEADVAITSSSSAARAASTSSSAGGVALPAYTPLCLTVQGTRISPSGPETYQQVSATACGYTRTNVFGGNIIATLGTASASIALTRPGTSGHVQVVGYTTAQPGQNGSAPPNLLVHFPGAKSASELSLLTEALGRSERSDVDTAVIAVLSPGQLPTAPFVPGVIYADDRDGTWTQAFSGGDANRPLTLIINPKGATVWKQEGSIEIASLCAALKKYLAPTTGVRVQFARLNARIGQPAPNFLFEPAPGRELPLRKVTGRELELVFWRSISKPSIDAVLGLQTTPGASAAQAPVVLAINDGESPELARAIAAESGFTATLVTDPKRQISSAYGVTMWPTVISIDAAGFITGIRFGYAPGGLVTSRARAGASR